MAAESIRIEYDLRDVLDGIRKEQAVGFAELRTALSAKANRADVESLRRQLQDYQGATERRLDKLEREEERRLVTEQVATEHEGRFLTRAQRRWAVVGYVALIAATIFGPLLAIVAAGH